MTKSDLIQAISSRLTHLPARDVEIVINTMFESMTEALTAGDRIEIRGFGSFSVRHRRARMGRNPKTGDAIAVPPKRVPFFTVGHELRKRINDDFEVIKTAPQVELEIPVPKAAVPKAAAPRAAVLKAGPAIEMISEAVPEADLAEAAVPEAAVPEAWPSHRDGP